MFTLTPQNTKLSQRLAVPYKGKVGIKLRGGGAHNKLWGTFPQDFQEWRMGQRCLRQRIINCSDFFFWIVLFYFLIEDCVELSCWVCVIGGTDGWWTSMSSRFVHEKILYARVKRFILLTFVISYLHKSTWIYACEFYIIFFFFFSPDCQKANFIQVKCLNSVKLIYDYNYDYYLFFTNHCP